jgi:hypothetical protein
VRKAKEDERKWRNKQRKAKKTAQYKTKKKNNKGQRETK